MHADAFDEADFFSAIARSGARVLLIGRRAPIAHGLPVLTADYDLRYQESTSLAVPSIDDLILTKRWSMRDKDVADIHLLETLRRARGGGG